MNIHEFQAKGLFREYGIPVPRGTACRTIDEVRTACEELGGGVCVVKAQIHAGGRGKAGGVRIAKSREEAIEHARTLLGAILVTHQTGPAGRKVSKLLIEEGLDIEREFYAALAVDRQRGGPVIIASAEGGVEIESVPQEKLLKESIDIHEGLRPFQARALAYGLGLTGDSAKQAASLLAKLARLFVDLDCSLAEINPLVLLRDGRILALDAKINFDDNALFRHTAVQELRDADEEDPIEARAANFDLSYVNLDGNIGCMVNGAGLAMATMDIIQHHGGEPANFLDVGGAASAERVTEAFKIILEDPSVKAILVNIFGGIVQCDIIAEGVLEAVQAVQLKVPLVVRLEGTNVERGRALLEESGLTIITARDMSEAARKAVEAAA
ncbi:MAG: ADP-forming succinate--CoA ligase subunit beta [Planctomycetota bacterium]|jgi:succinyl-CoA synthetase beta subunit